MTSYKIVETDVLIAGGGAAGIRAALEARKHLDNVVIVSKGKIGGSGCVVLSEGGICAPFGHRDSRDNPKAYLEDMLRGGYNLNNRRLAEAMTSEACTRIVDLEKYGLAFIKEEGRFLQVLGAGHSHPRQCIIAGPREKTGVAFGRVLAEVAQKAGIKFFENIMLVELLTDDHLVVGGVGFNTRDGGWTVFRSKATVLATGCAGRLYKHTDNPAGITGDGYAVAYRAGAELIDMEFIQFYPVLTLWPVQNFFIRVSTFFDGARLRNASGEYFMKRYDPERGDLATRDVMAKAIFFEVQDGRGVKDGVYFDYTAMTKDLIETKYRFHLETFLARGVDIRRDPIIVAPAVHSFMGGLRINERCEASIANLYAAGEAAGGIHGANRLAANALTETQIFGARAGEYAAKRALSIGRHEFDPDQVERVIETTANFSRQKGYKPEKVRAKLSELMWNKVGIVRNREGLEAALEEIKRIRVEDMPKVGADGPGELAGAVELVNMLDVAEMVAKSALLRKESRGSHYRSDFPEMNDREWTKNIVVHVGGIRKEVVGT